MTEVRLRPMTAEEHRGWLPWMIEQYAQEIAERVGGDPQAAHERAEASMRDLLPTGLATPGHVLMIGEVADLGRIGYLWFGPSSDDPQRAWLYDVWVDEPHRGRGFGRALMDAFESEAGDRGFRGVGLNVFAHNAVARSLYEAVGYAEVARQMHKAILR